MAYYVKYRIPFRDVNEKQYKVEIFDYVQVLPTPAPQAIILKPGDTPLVIDEDDSKEFYASIRTQTGNITICTKIDPQEAMPQGGTLDLADIMPKNNTDRPVQVFVWNEEYQWQFVWLGYLSCEAYNQPYTDVPENIQIPINSVLETWKSLYYRNNAKIITTGYLLAELCLSTPWNGDVLFPHWPQDCEYFWYLKISTSLFIERTEYQVEESTLYKLEGKSYYNILETICRFMGWTARESGNNIYFQKNQGVGILADTEQRQMSALSWRGTDHQRSIVAGAQSVKVTAHLYKMEIDMKLPDFPLVGLMEARDNRITWHYVYTWPSIEQAINSNISMHQYKGIIRLGVYGGTMEYNQYSFEYSDETTNVQTVIEKSIAYDDNLSINPAVLAYTYTNNQYEIDAGAFYARMEIDLASQHDTNHLSTKDGVYLSLFPAAWNGYIGGTTKPIFEMRSVIAFTAYEHGVFVIDAKFAKFWDMPDVNAQGGDQCRFVIQLQVGNKYWDGETGHWETTPKFFYPKNVYNNDKFYNNWTSDLGIDQIDGYCIPTYELNTMGEVVLRIFPETRRYTGDFANIDWNVLSFGVFFSELTLKYYPRKNVKYNERNENTYYDVLNTKFADGKSTDTDLASYLHNYPSTSFLYEDSDEGLFELLKPMEKLTYLKSDGTTEERRPEMDLLNRMAEYYSKPRTILNLEVQHIDDKPLPLLRYVGLGDGKLYAPMSASRDFQLDKSTINFMELPEQPSES